MSEKRIIVIDIQGFYLDNKLYAKEVCISGVNSELITFLIEPPPKYIELTKKDRITNKWLYNHLHGLDWYTGTNTQNDFINYLISTLKQIEGYPFVYVKGYEKEKWLKELLGEKIELCIINLDELNCANIKTLYKYNKHIDICKYHNKNNTNYLCAEKTVILLKNFIKLYSNKGNV